MYVCKVSNFFMLLFFFYLLFFILFNAENKNGSCLMKFTAFEIMFSNPQPEQELTAQSFLVQLIN